MLTSSLCHRKELACLLSAHSPDSVGPLPGIATEGEIEGLPDAGKVPVAGEGEGATGGGGAS